jgi:hypothetical protein
MEVHSAEARYCRYHDPDRPDLRAAAIEKNRRGHQRYFERYRMAKLIAKAVPAAIDRDLSRA